MNTLVRILIALLIGLLVFWIGTLLLPHTFAVVLGILAGLLWFLSGRDV